MSFLSGSGTPSLSLAQVMDMFKMVKQGGQVFGMPQTYAPDQGLQSYMANQQGQQAFADFFKFNKPVEGADPNNLNSARSEMLAKFKDTGYNQADLLNGRAWNQLQSNTDQSLRDSYIRYMETPEMKRAMQLKQWKF